MNLPNITPRRSLSANFTHKTLRRAIKTKRRQDMRREVKELLQMKRITFLKRPVGALLALAFVITSGAGVYAAANWFGGVVGVASDDSIMTVDLSKCASNLPPGVPTETDRAHVQFKITGNPHPSAAELEHKLLVNCEFDSVLGFYQAKLGTNIGTPPAVVKGVDAAKNTITLSFTWANQELTKTFGLAQGAIVMDKGKEGTLKQFQSGDTVVFAYKTARSVDELADPFAQPVELVGLFKTQYDTREFLESAKNFYVRSNIMPLSQYQQLHQ